MIRNLIREFLLQEEVFGAQAFVYHGSHSPPEEFKKFIVDDEFKAGKKAGSTFGSGLYTVYDLNGSMTLKGGYGVYIYKLKVNLYGFISLDPEITKKIYKKDIDIAEQAKISGASKETINYLQRFLKANNGKASNNDRVAEEIVPHIKGDVKGIIYYRPRDGKCALLYDSSTAVPVSWTEVPRYNDLKTANDLKFEKFDKESIKTSLKRSAMNSINKLTHEKPVEILVKELFKLPPDERIVGTQGLDLRRSSITKLPDNMIINGNFVLDNSEIKEIPKGIKVTGGKYGTLVSFANSKITKLPDDFTVGQDISINLRDSKIANLPKGLAGTKINLALNQGSELSSIPSGFIFSYLDLTGSKIKSLPDDIVVNSKLIIKDTDITDIPPGVTGKIEKD